MSDENTQDMNNVTPPEEATPPMVIHGQYIRDISFESPNAPASLYEQTTGQPNIDIKINMDAREIKNDNVKNLYETVLEVTASAKSGEMVLFVAEIQYAASVSFSEAVPEEEVHPILLIEIPRLLFPYLRQQLSDLTLRGGFPPLMLNPVDFQALYMERFAPDIKKAQGELHAGLKKDEPESEAEAKTENA